MPLHELVLPKQACSHVMLLPRRALMLPHYMDITVSDDEHAAMAGVIL